MIIIISNQEEKDLKDLTEIIAQIRSELKDNFNKVIISR
jgi:hypothetical protein